MPTPDGEQFKTWFHATRSPQSEFTAAPTIHVGDLGTATNREDQMKYLTKSGETWSINAVKPSQHMEFHDKLLDDNIANAAEKRYLEKHNYPVPASVKDSSTPIDDYATAREVVGAARALGKNKALRYNNFVEGGISAIIPSPHFNTSIHRLSPDEIDRDSLELVDDRRIQEAKDPHQQAVLPMDYSGLKESNVTWSHRRLQTPAKIAPLSEAAKLLAKKHVLWENPIWDEELQAWV